MSVHSLARNTLVHGSVRLVRVNLTSGQTYETSYEVPLGYWYCWTPTSLSQATSGTGSIALWMQVGQTSARLACKGCPLVLYRVNSEAGAVLMSLLWMNSASSESGVGVFDQGRRHH